MRKAQKEQAESFIRLLGQAHDEIKRAIDKGVEVLAYCPWSAVDVLSTSNGVKKRYGLIYVDRTDSDARQCARIRKDSFYWYQKVIGSNGAELD